jgi:DNA-binding winged helix-turn-helix (wHTH) protein
MRSANSSKSGRFGSPYTASVSYRALTLRRQLMPLLLIQREQNPPSEGYHRPWTVAHEPCPVADRGALQFGRFLIVPRRRELFADGVPVKLGSRALDLLLVLLEADGLLVTKDELLQRGWPGIVVSDENVKVQIAALRRALGQDRDLILTDVGRGYRFTGTVRAIGARGGGDGGARQRQRQTRARRQRRPGPRLTHLAIAGG